MVGYRRAHGHTTRLGAARAILELGMRLREHEELERRIGELEAALEKTGDRTDDVA